MTSAARLEEAITYRDRLEQNLKFQEGFRVWHGSVQLSFGSYVAIITTKCSGREGLIDALAAEEKMLRNSLDALGVELDG